MPRLIDADAVKDNINEWLDCVGTVLIGKGLSYTWELEGCIDDAPTIEAEPVRHGRWISHEGYDECCLCHSKSIYPHNYCPNCGAKMDKPANT